MATATIIAPEIAPNSGIMLQRIKNKTTNKRYLISFFIKTPKISSAKNNGKLTLLTASIAKHYQSNKFDQLCKSIKKTVFTIHLDLYYNLQIQ